MCGIYFSAVQDIERVPDGSIVDLLKKRGPDNIGSIQRTVNLDSSTRPIFVNIVSTVLSLRGDGTINQPIQDPSSGSVLCWNGEAWKHSDKPVVGNDAQVVFDSMLSATQDQPQGDGLSFERNAASLTAFQEVIGSISGPFAFVFYEARSQRVFFGRDILGRRSLLIRKGPQEELTISSVCNEAPLEAWEEVEANGIYVLDLTAYLIRAHDNVKDSMKILQLEGVLRESLCYRVLNIPDPPSNSEPPTRIAILFSGGLDFDLLNVAFENPRALAAAEESLTKAKAVEGGGASDEFVYDKCPDRITGLSSYNELLQICPERVWRFVSINVPYPEAMEHRTQIVSLVYPHNTEMDLSIAYALYFAARGRGRIQTPAEDDPVPYTTSARVLLSGLGADELFAGYTRHATAFRRAGYPGLLDELDLDFNRLGKRNLGRDDRVISHWGREARYPYLDEKFIHWTLKQPVWEKCSFTRSNASNIQAFQGASSLEPGKNMLRLLAWNLGMKRAATEKKRAIQFGARTAKMTSGRVKGTQIIA
ncbi:MAG: hypothetical protein Q9187_000338 [Circinaria calcarea]